MSMCVRVQRRVYISATYSQATVYAKPKVTAITKKLISLIPLQLRPLTHYIHQGRGQVAAVRHAVRLAVLHRHLSMLVPISHAPICGRSLRFPLVVNVVAISKTVVAIAMVIVTVAVVRTSAAVPALVAMLVPGRLGMGHVNPNIHIPVTCGMEGSKTNK